MSQVMRPPVRFKPPLKKTPVTLAVDSAVCNPVVDSSISTHSQVHTLLSFCEENTSQRNCNSQATVSLTGKGKIKKTYQYKYFNNHKNVAVVKRAKLFTAAKIKNTKVKEKREVYDYTLTPSSPQESVKKKVRRSKAQVSYLHCLFVNLI